MFDHAELLSPIPCTMMADEMATGRRSLHHRLRPLVLPKAMRRTRSRSEYLGALARKPDA